MLVDVSKIKEHPLNTEVYGSITPSDISTLKESIESLGLLQPLIVTKKYTLISGHRRLACLRELEIEQAECIVKDIEDDDAIVFIIESNRQRVKTARQQLNEAKYLFEYYGRHQGKRNDLSLVHNDAQVGIKTRDKVSNEVGTSRGTVSRLLYIDEHFPSLIDIIGTQITLNKAYLEVREYVRKKELDKAGEAFKKNGKTKEVLTKTYVLYNQSCEKMTQVEDSSVQYIFSSPPYHLIRDYGVRGSIGEDEDLNVYLERMMTVMKECFRVMRDDATMFLVYGDKYQDGSMLMSPERLIIKMIDYGFKLRNKIIWRKGVSNPESAKNRFTQNHEVIYFLTKTNKYKIDIDALRIDYKDPSPIYIAPSYHKPVKDNSVGTKSSRLKNPNGKVPNAVELLDDFVFASKRNQEKKKEANSYDIHNSTFPVELVDRFTGACLEPGDIGMDPFCGSGTVLESVIKHNGFGIGYDTQPKYIEYCEERLQ